MTLLDGKVISEAVKNEIKKEVASLIDAGKRAPHLVAVLVGSDPASQSYVASKDKACKSIGMTSSLYLLDETITEQELLKTIHFLNNDPDVDGFIVQQPLPKHINADTILEAINPEKDVDGFHPTNVGKMALGLDTFLPATPYGIMELLERYDIQTEGKHVVVLGRSNIVGTPVSLLLSRKAKRGNATVTLCHSKTDNLADYCRQADILIAAIGQPHFVTADMVKPGAVIIDVGIHRIEDASKEKGYYITGDVKFDEVSKIASAITPVPGGIGLMTIAALLMNTMKAYHKNQKQ
jgi:methylenetetrahydrofolate dehydrogenase (NADP+)/methenyltetrahydrofolate cyclohydrolase